MGLLRNYPAPHPKTYEQMKMVCPSRQKGTKGVLSLKEKDEYAFSLFTLHTYEKTFDRSLNIRRFRDTFRCLFPWRADVFHNLWLYRSVVSIRDLALILSSSPTLQVCGNGYGPDVVCKTCFDSLLMSLKCMETF